MNKTSKKNQTHIIANNQAGKALAAVAPLSAADAQQLVHLRSGQREIALEGSYSTKHASAAK